MICIPVIGPNMVQALEDIKKARPLADVIELRIDLIETFDLKKLLEATGPEVIVTFRPIREGGKCTLPDLDRSKILAEALVLGAKFIDIEWDAIQHLKNVDQSKVIVSRHFFNEFPTNLIEIIATLDKHPVAITKVAVKIEELSQNAILFSALQNKKKPLILIGMGEEGLISRITTRVFGGFLTFASLNSGKESAPGQIAAEELRNRFRFKKTGQQTKLFGVVGNPVSHSLSPDIHNAGFEVIGFDGLYLPLKVSDCDSFMKNLAPFFEGLSVTIPHKEKMLTKVKNPSEILNKIGALNTLSKLPQQNWEGMNTDIDAAIKSIIEVLPAGSLKDQTVLVVGAGGASRAIAIGAMQAGAKVTITNRTVSKGKTVADELGIPFISLEDILLFETLPYQVIMNTTSVGMVPHIEESPLPGIQFLPNQVVFDAIYNPHKTKLILNAEIDGAFCITGREMFVKQGALQFERWTGKKAPLDLFRNILNEKLG
jgi:3-dehydroquinate dehydratase/shikimate dehydrogenase